MTERPKPLTSPQERRRQYQEEQGNPPEPGAPGQRDWQSLIEEQIARLDLDNLPNKGRPLDLSVDPYVKPEDELANRVLKNAGFTLPWIEEGQRLDAEVNAARQKLDRAWRETRELRDAQLCAGHQWVEGAWAAALREFRAQVEEINRKIRDFNLKVPVASLQKFSIRVDEELARLGISDEE